jgi:hypothetical protein
MHQIPGNPARWQERRRRSGHVYVGKGSFETAKIFGAAVDGTLRGGSAEYRVGADEKLCALLFDTADDQERVGNGYGNFKNVNAGIRDGERELEGVFCRGVAQDGDEAAGAHQLKDLGFGS